MKKNLALLTLGFLIYSNTLKSSFVFDDFETIVNNPAIRHLNLAVLWQAFNTRFVVGLTLAFNYALGKDHVLGYHVFNTLVHVLNSYLVYSFVCLTYQTPRMSRHVPTVHAKWLGFLTALVFLTHPLQTQAVTYIWQRATSLAALFYLGALVFYIKARLKSSWGYYVLCLLFTVLGMFTKEIVFTLPFAILLYELIFLEAKTRKILFFIPLFLTFFIIPWAMTQANEHTLLLLRPVNALRPDFILTELNVLRTYLRLFILPFHQSVDYNYPRAWSLLEPNTFLSFMTLVGLFSWGVFLLKKYPLLAFGIFWFFLTVSVEALAAQGSFLFEHRLYLPLMGLSLFLVTGLSHFFKKNPRRLTFILLGIVTAFSLLTYQRNFVWKDAFTLWDNAVREFPHNGRAYAGRGDALLRNGFSDQALPDLNKAIELEAHHAEAYTNRALVYQNKNLWEQALADCNKAIQINPRLVSAYNNRAVAYQKMGLPDKVLEDLSQMIRLEPDNANTYNNRGIVFATKGLFDQAFLDFNKAIELDPNFTNAYNNRAKLKEALGKINP